MQATAKRCKEWCQLFQHLATVRTLIQKWREIKKGTEGPSKWGRRTRPLIGGVSWIYPQEIGALTPTRDQGDGQWQSETHQIDHARILSKSLVTLLRSCGQSGAIGPLLNRTFGGYFARHVRVRPQGQSPVPLSLSMISLQNWIAGQPDVTVEAWCLLWRARLCASRTNDVILSSDLYHWELVRAYRKYIADTLWCPSPGVAQLIRATEDHEGIPALTSKQTRRGSEKRTPPL